LCGDVAAGEAGDEGGAFRNTLCFGRHGALQ
jgi:hypothetical protein